MINLEGKVAVVTGASRGIGQAIAYKLAEQGAQLALCSRSEASLAETLSTLTERGVKVKGFAVDVSAADSVKGMVDEVVKEFGQVDILVNNAGITRDGLLMRMSDEDWDMVIDTNLRSAFYFARALARPMMKKKTGSIINIASVVGLMGNPGQANYSASKGGLIALTKSLAKELASRNIRANAVAPGFIETSMTDELTDEARQNLLNLIPMAKFGSPEEIANVVAFLASDDSSYITGQVLSVCGGMVTA